MVAASQVDSNLINTALLCFSGRYLGVKCTMKQGVPLNAVSKLLPCNTQHDCPNTLLNVVRYASQLLAHTVHQIKSKRSSLHAACPAQDHSLELSETGEDSAKSSSP